MDDARFSLIARTIADPQRFAILQRIAAQAEAACMTIKREFPISESTLSHHIKALGEAGLIRVRKEGKCGYFAADRRALRAYTAELHRRLESTAPSAANRRTSAKPRG